MLYCLSADLLSHKIQNAVKKSTIVPQKQKNYLFLPVIRFTLLCSVPNIHGSHGYFSHLPISNDFNLMKEVKLMVLVDIESADGGFSEKYSRSQIDGPSV